MKKIKMCTSESVTFREGCEKYLDNCRQRNLREGTINHYKQSYTQFFKFFDKDMLVSDINEKSYQEYVVHLRKILHNDVSINAYLRDFITTMHFLMREGYVANFRMQSIKVDRSGVETYSDSELTILLKKPNVKKCSFTEYQCWVITNFLFSTAIRQRSLMHVKIKDVDFDNKGTRLTTKKSLECKAIIQKHSKDFGGSLEDPDVIKLCGCSRNSYYKYKREIKHIYICNDSIL